ncbi:MAG: ribosomal protein [Planctomycetota bacterium]|jgi:small subunit ribosomal protein S16
MVVLRMKRMGRAHAPFYRLSAMDKRSPRDGAVIENLGWYNPLGKPGAQYQFNVERVQYWLSVGAQPSETAANLLKKVGVDPTPGKKA